MQTVVVYSSVLIVDANGILVVIESVSLNAVGEAFRAVMITNISGSLTLM